MKAEPLLPRIESTIANAKALIFQCKATSAGTLAEVCELNPIGFLDPTLVLIVKILSAKKLIPECEIQPVMDGALEVMDGMMGGTNEPPSQPMMGK